MHENIIAVEIESRMTGMRNDAQVALLQRFFKCGEGEYGEGDRFLGLRVPQTRAIVKDYRNKSTLSDAEQLVKSEWHEVRLAGFLLMIELYNQAKRVGDRQQKEVVDAYLASISRANNWDLVDLSAPYILGDWLVGHPEEREILRRLSSVGGGLWHQRVAIVATFMLIRHGEFADTLEIATRYSRHPHDLIRKATGWMLREMGKRGGLKELRAFLDIHAPFMPRTMLRYAIEKFPQQERQYYLKLKTSVPGSN